MATSSGSIIHSHNRKDMTFWGLDEDELNKLFSSSNRENDFLDLPAELVTRFVLDIRQKCKERECIVIEMHTFEQTPFPWLSFSLVLHALVETRSMVVLLCEKNETPMDYSEWIDRDGRPRQCFRNMAIYTNVKDNDRAQRLYYANMDSGSIKPLKEALEEYHGEDFSPYYKRWLTDPYRGRGYYTHPFDHIPVKNISPVFKDYRTEDQWRKAGYEVPEDAPFALLHGQIGTVALSTYYAREDVINTRAKDVTPKGCTTIQKGMACPFVSGFVVGRNCNDCRYFKGIRSETGLVFCEGWKD